ncbi:MAG: ATP-binding protein [Paludibacteraceae bacterium]|nr:ATP-binding protein [Paludibacteraceae bacterium]
MEVKQKWEKQGGVFFPIPGDTTLHITPGMGVFQVCEIKGLGGTRMGLKKMAERFTFNFKVYDLGVDETIDRIKFTWDSDLFVNSQKNLGVIFNGLKGTGKTIAAKVLCNKMNIPVLIVNNPSDGLLGFIQSLCFECVVLIDEAEKTFDEDGDVLLQMIDGVYNETRKLYILTTNKLSLDDNLLGRPGRIRYIKQFGNLTAKAVTDYIDDNLKDKSKVDMILNVVDLLEISTIDILKAIVDEVNIHGAISDNSMLNIPKSTYKVDVVCFDEVPKNRFDELKSFIISRLEMNESVAGWLTKSWKNEENERESNRDIIDREFDADCNSVQIASRYPSLTRNQKTRMGTILDQPDLDGFFVMKNSWNDTETLCCVISYGGAPSLYRGGLQRNLI